MRAAQSMGLFLRTWRSEWAGLTRGQLALAVSRAAGRNVAVPVIRAWEMGQAPGSTEELQALLEVMGRHGLSRPEVEQFRQAVFAACLDRHYEGLLGGESLADLPDLEEVTEALCAREDVQRGTLSLVTLTIGVEELRQARQADLLSTRGRRTGRARQAALVRMLDVLARRHGYSGRETVAARLFAEAADVAATDFGPSGLGGDLTELVLRSRAVQKEYVAAYVKSAGIQTSGVSGHCARRQMELYAGLWARGERGAAVVSLTRAANYASEGPQPESAAELLAQCDRLRGWADGWEEVDFQLFWTSLNLGLLNRAQRHLAVLARWHGAPFAGCSWALMAAAWALATEDRQAAEAEVESAIAMAGETGYDEVPALARRLLTRCESGPRIVRERP